MAEQVERKNRYFKTIVSQLTSFDRVMERTKIFKQAKMVNWYDPRQLAATALKALVSGTFASYADNRELQAALDPEKIPFDCSTDQANNEKLNELWIDFVSDTGDGFNSTYTVAELVAQSLQVGLNPDVTASSKPANSNWEIPAGQLLLLGGDQVYPTPSMVEYETRFKIPFSAASAKYHTNESISPKMFAIPGNHDWYDGLGNFKKLFCQRRRIGKWQTEQKRSYFAIRLPHNYWLWAIDVQLNSDIDQPQKDYFREMATRHMQHGDKVILCTSEPAWVYKVMHSKDESYKRLKFFEQVFITHDKYQLTGGKKFKLVATLTGDLHHYSRYEELKKTSEGTEYTNHLITAGGGGAFLHPTHDLPQTLTGLDEENDSILNNTQFKDPEMQACFPSKKQSRKIANRILRFPFNNIAFWITMTVIQLLLAWLLQSLTQQDNLPFMHQLAAANGFSQFLNITLHHLLITPVVLIISLVLFAGFTVFADNKSAKGNFRWLGAIHGLMQLVTMFLFIWLFSWFNFSFLNITSGIGFFFVYVIEALIIGGLAGSFIFGFYLWFSSRVLGIHLDESFSSLGHPHFKNFLRIHITPDGDVTIYPVGIKKTVTKWKQDVKEEKPTFIQAEKAEYYLIEPPIIIKNSKP